MQENLSNRYAIKDLLYLMARLRDPQNGCPWDIEQTDSDIINYSIEEIYELADAIERNDGDDIADELGDVLFQVVFLAHLGEERGDYDFATVVHGVCDKLIRRHPHVFPTGELYSEQSSSEKTVIDSAGVKDQWETIKQRERNKKQQQSVFDNVPLALPAVNRAVKIQKRATKIGLDWPTTEGPLNKLREECDELVAAIEHDPRDQRAIEEELGDLFFSMINVARKLAIDPEQALRQANRKFMERATLIEKHTVKKRGDGELGDSETLAEKDIEALWQLAKQ